MKNYLETVPGLNANENARKLPAAFKTLQTDLTLCIIKNSYEPPD
jgi:hypothetical protein